MEQERDGGLCSRGSHPRADGNAVRDARPGPGDHGQCPQRWALRHSPGGQARCPEDPPGGHRGAAPTAEPASSPAGRRGSLRVQRQAPCYEPAAGLPHGAPRTGAPRSPRGHQQVSRGSARPAPTRTRLAASPAAACLSAWGREGRPGPARSRSAWSPPGSGALRGTAAPGRLPGSGHGVTGPSTARRALCARVAVLGPTRARPSPGSGPLTEPRRPRLPRRLRAGLAAEGAQRRHGRLLQQSGREWPRGRRRLRTQPAAACEEPSAGGRRPVRRVTRRRVRGSSDLTLPCKLERERGSSCHARPVPRPAVCGRRPSGSPFCPGDGEGKGRLLRQQPHRRGPGRVGPAPCTAAGVRGAKNGGLLGHRPCPQTARGVEAAHGSSPGTRAQGGLPRPHRQQTRGSACPLAPGRGLGKSQAGWQPTPRSPLV